MTLLLLRRLAAAVVTAFGVATVVFFLVPLLPGDPVDAVVGDLASAEDRETARHRLGLDQPLGRRYVGYLRGLAQGSLGASFRQPNVSVGSEIARVLPSTAVLALASLLIAWGLGVPLGAIAAARRGRPLDAAATTFAVGLQAVPNFWLGPILILVSCVWLRWLPLPGDDSSSLRALLLPAMTLGGALTALLVRMTRASLLDVLREPFVTVARAKGLSESTVLYKHALRNALLPVVTIAGSQLGALLGGALIIEKIFERPGLGSLFLEAFSERDLPVLQGCVLVMALCYVVVNVAVDLAYSWIDPRIRLA